MRLSSIRESFKQRFFLPGALQLPGSFEAEEVLTSNDCSPTIRPAEEFLRDFRLCEQLGEGVSGVVRRCEELATGKHFAVKISRPKSEETVARLREEASAMRKLNHPSIASFHSLFWSKQENVYYSLLELAQGKDLDRALGATGVLPEETACRIIFQVLKGIKYLHNQGVVHRDLKPANLVVSTDFSTVKIVDFGVAKFGSRYNLLEVPEPLLIGSPTGDPEYRAPEMKAGSLYGKEVDLWALGVIAYQLLTGRRPFKSASWNDESFLEGLEKAGVSASAVELIASLLIPDPAQRCSAEAAAKHEWFATERKASAEIEVTGSFVELLNGGSDREDSVDVSPKST